MRPWNNTDSSVTASYGGGSTALGSQETFLVDITKDTAF